MKYIIPIVQGIFLLVLSFLCPILMLFALPFIKWDKEPTDGVIRGDLPNWLSWLSTPDERLPGGMYEPTVKKIYDKYGKWFTSWYWLGVRNTIMGLAVDLGKTTSDYIPETPLGYWERNDIWRYSCVFGPLKFVVGYQVYKILDGTFIAAPVFTLKRY